MGLLRFYARGGGASSGRTRSLVQLAADRLPPRFEHNGVVTPASARPQHAVEGESADCRSHPAVYFDFDLVLHAGDRSSGCRGQEVGVGHVVNADVPRRARCQGCRCYPMSSSSSWTRRDT